MNQQVSRLISKVAGNKTTKRMMKKIYQSFDNIERGKFIKNLKLFIKQKNDSVQKS